jgi:hypothetical protein
MDGGMDGGMEVSKPYHMVIMEAHSSMQKHFHPKKFITKFFKKKGLLFQPENTNVFKFFIFVVVSFVAFLLESFSLFVTLNPTIRLGWWWGGGGSPVGEGGSPAGYYLTPNVWLSWVNTPITRLFYPPTHPPTSQPYNDLEIW